MIGCREVVLDDEMRVTHNIEFSVGPGVRLAA